MSVYTDFFFFFFVCVCVYAPNAILLFNCTSNVISLWILFSPKSIKLFFLSFFSDVTEPDVHSCDRGHQSVKFRVTCTWRQAVEKFQMDFLFSSTLEIYWRNSFGDKLNTEIIRYIHFQLKNWEQGCLCSGFFFLNTSVPEIL